jgi:hypothetical protein
MVRGSRMLRSLKTAVYGAENPPFHECPSGIDYEAFYNPLVMEGNSATVDSLPVALYDVCLSCKLTDGYLKFGETVRASACSTVTTAKGYASKGAARKYAWVLGRTRPLVLVPLLGWGAE